MEVRPAAAVQRCALFMPAPFVDETGIFCRSLDADVPRLVVPPCVDLSLFRPEGPRDPELLSLPFPRILFFSRIDVGKGIIDARLTPSPCCGRSEGRDGGHLRSATPRSRNGRRQSSTDASTRSARRRATEAFTT